MIKVFGHGNLCFDPILRQTSNGIAVCSMRLAMRTAFKGEDGSPVTDFYDVTAWRGLAETCAKYLKKGSAIVIEGDLRRKSFTDKNGQERQDVDITVNTLEFAGGRHDATGNATAAPAPAPAPEQSVPGADDDLPF